MIIRRDGDDDLFITQPDHAALSGRIMQHVVSLRNHPRAASILLAIGEHDNGWAEPDQAPTVNPATGEPIDFITAPPEVRQGVWPRGVARLSSEPWAAALVAHHAVAVYDRYRGDPAWREFFARMEATRDALGRAAGPKFETLLADYRYVRLGDLLSLMICAGWTEAQEFDKWTLAWREGDLSVIPWPFDVKSLEVAVPAKRLRVARYGSDDELRGAIAAAPVEQLHGAIANKATVEGPAREELEGIRKEIARLQTERQAVEREFDRFTSSFTTDRPVVPAPGPVVVPAAPPAAFDLAALDAMTTPISVPLPPVVVPPAPPQHANPRSSLAPGILIALMVALGAAGYYAWTQTRPAEVSAPVVVMQPAPAPVTPQPSAPAAEPPPPAAPAPSFESVVTTTAAVWVRVVADGETVVARELPADARVSFIARESIVIRTGNAGAVRLTMSGVDQGAIGRPGQVITRRFDVPK
jgi:hypothetical protein